MQHVFHIKYPTKKTNEFNLLLTLPSQHQRRPLQPLGHLTSPPPQAEAVRGRQGDRRRRFAIPANRCT
eukprot:592711-Amorphochlora_amoeboformis.AAC.1